MRFLLGVIG